MGVLSIITCSKDKHSFWREAEQEYLKRLPKWLKVQISVLGVRNSKNREPVQIQLEESRLLLQSLNEGDRLVILDGDGQKLTSMEFAQWLEGRWQAPSKTVLAIGGPWGWSDSVKSRADESVSLSRLTFPGQLAKLILIEQIYRAYTVSQNRAYHK